MRSLRPTERVCLIALLLIAWGLRWIALMDVPPGWRDDDLIELYTFSGRVLEEGPVLYYAGASGHEPLYHTLRAPLLAVAGINQASARWMSATAGTLTVLLAWALGRRALGPLSALLTAALMSTSFWGLMYSRVAIRHIGTLPWALLALYWGWRLLRTPTGLRRTGIWIGIAGIALGTAGALLTYYAGRLLPLLLIGLFPLLRPQHGRWKPYVLGIGLGVLLAVPMFWAASRLPGADARVSELAVPIHALRSGDPVPLLKTAWTTMGMFHAGGDPEWLYNVSERPVFGPLGAAFFYASIAIHCARWREPSSRMLLLWLVAGISPALISLPPSSYGHTILAMPAVYLSLAVLPVTLRNTLSKWLPGNWRWLRLVTLALFVGSVGVRDLNDYFGTWPRASMVRFLYRADYRALAEALRAGRGDEGGPLDTAAGLAVGSMLPGPWDKVAVHTDAGATAQHLRWFNPERALVFVNGASTVVILQDEGAKAAPIQRLLADAEPMDAPSGMQGFLVSLPRTGDAGLDRTIEGAAVASRPFGGAFVLEAISWHPSVEESQPSWLATWWSVRAELPLPDEELIPHPPPPGVYNGPRLKVFAHLWSGDDQVAIDDGLWVDPYSLKPGDLVLQYHRFEAGAHSREDLRLDIGLYDPLTGSRWTTPEGEDKLSFELAQEAP